MRKYPKKNYPQIQLLEDMLALDRVGVEVTLSLLAKAKGLTKHRIDITMIEAEDVGLIECTKHAWHGNAQRFVFSLSDVGRAVINAYHIAMIGKNPVAELEKLADELLMASGDRLLNIIPEETVISVDIGELLVNGGSPNAKRLACRVV